MEIASRGGRAEQRNGTGGASKYLADLPSRGLLSSTVLSTNPGGIRVYISGRDTSPPEEQIIKTDTTNILIRSLQLNKQKHELKDLKPKSSDACSRGKRSAESRNGGILTKKANIGACSSGSTNQDASSVLPSEEELRSFTVEKLRALLKEKGLSAKGKKDELISRLRDDD